MKTLFISFVVSRILDAMMTYTFVYMLHEAREMNPVVTGPVALVGAQVAGFFVIAVLGRKLPSTVLTAGIISWFPVFWDVMMICRA